jgi:WD40 repeat protein
MLFTLVALSLLLGFPAVAPAQGYSAEPALVIDRATVDGNIQRLAFFPDGKRFVTVSLDSTVRIWTLEGKMVASMDAHRKGVMGVAISPDGNTVVTAGLDGTVAVFGPDGTLRSTIEPGAGALYAVAFSPDGTRIACAVGHEVQVWSLSGERLAILAGHTGPVIDVAYLPDGSIVSASGYYDHVVKLWSSTGGFLRDVLVPPGNILSFSVSTGGSTFACGTDAGLVQVSRFNGGDPKNFRAFRSLVTDPTTLSADGTLVAFASPSKGKVDVANLADGTTFELGSGLDGQTPSALAFSPNGRYLAAGTTSGRVAIWKRTDR